MTFLVQRELFSEEILELKKKYEGSLCLLVDRRCVWGGNRWIVLSKQFVMNYPVNCNENIWTKISRNSSNVLKFEWCWYWLGVFYAARLNGAAVAGKGTWKNWEGTNFRVPFLHTRNCFNQAYVCEYAKLLTFFFSTVKDLFWRWLRMSGIFLKT